jgi:alpha-tubulin suppressor-like RCC1 family protein
VKAIVAGSSHTCAITSGGGAKCWGSNFEGKLGDGTTENRLTPVNVKGLSSGVETIAIGFFHTCALTSGGGVKCWGSNGSGQLGDGTKKHKLTPVDVRGLTSDVRAITTGDSHTCALTSNGGVKCWGINFSGELGDGTREGKSTPVDVYGLTSGVKAIVADTSQTCAIISGEGMKCWGLNRSGQLGDGTTEDRLTPLDVRGLTSGAKAIAMGGSHTCIITNSGSYQCWGANWNGQLGNGTTWRVKPKDQIIRLTPQGVEMREK